MKNIEDKFKDLFHDEQFPKDDGFDSEGLWGDISQSMDQKMPSSNNKRIIPLFLFLLFAGLTIVGSYFLYQKNDLYSSDKNIIQDIDKIKEDISNIKKDINKIEKVNSKNRIDKEEDFASTQPPNELDKINLEKVLIDQIEISDFEQLHTTQVDFKHTSTSVVQSPEKVSNNFSFTSIDETQNHLVIKEDASEKESYESSIGQNQVKGSPEYILKEQKNLAFNFLPLIVSSIDLINHQLSTLELLEMPIPNNEKEKSLIWNIGLFGGANTMNLNFKSENLSGLALLKKEANSNELGGSFVINVGVLWKDRWSFSTGLEYHQLMSKFEYIEEKEVQVQKENQLLTVWIDAATNDTVNSNYGTATVTNIQTREVIHYNKYNRISIPLEFGTHQNIGKMMFGISTGPVINFNYSQLGKTLDKDLVISEYTEDSSIAPFSKVDVGFRLSPFIGYQISESLNFMLRPQMSWQFNSKFQDTDIKTTSRQLNINAGFRYNFK